MPTNNPFYNQLIELSSIARDVETVVPSDFTEFSTIPIALRVATGGSLRLTTIKGNVRDIVVLDGEVLPVGTVKVHATGTTATGIIAYFL